jgi:hypothetical protein
MLPGTVGPLWPPLSPLPGHADTRRMPPRSPRVPCPADLQLLAETGRATPVARDRHAAALRIPADEWRDWLATPAVHHRASGDCQQVSRCVTASV